MDLEQQVQRDLSTAIEKVVREQMGGYNSPLHKMVDAVVSEKATDIKALLRAAITDVVSAEEFKSEIRSAFAHSLARNLMNEYKGEIEKRANELRQQADFRARVTIAIEEIVTDSMKKGQQP
jgi:hypothetical protein